MYRTRIFLSVMYRTRLSQSHGQTKALFSTCTAWNTLSGSDTAKTLSRGQVQSLCYAPKYDRWFSFCIPHAHNRAAQSVNGTLCFLKIGKIRENCHRWGYYGGEYNPQHVCAILQQKRSAAQGEISLAGSYWWQSGSISKSRPQLEDHHVECSRIRGMEEDCLVLFIDNIGRKALRNILKIRNIKSGVCWKRTWIFLQIPLFNAQWEQFCA